MAPFVHHSSLPPFLQPSTTPWRARCTTAPRGRPTPGETSRGVVAVKRGPAPCVTTFLAASPARPLACCMVRPHACALAPFVEASRTHARPSPPPPPPHPLCLAPFGRRGSGHLRPLPGTDLSAAMHDYALEWTADGAGRPLRMRWLVDGVQFHEQALNTSWSAGAASPYTQGGCRWWQVLVVPPWVPLVAGSGGAAAAAAAVAALRCHCQRRDCYIGGTASLTCPPHRAPPPPPTHTPTHTPFVGHTCRWAALGPALPPGPQPGGRRRLLPDFPVRGLEHARPVGRHVSGVGAAAHGGRARQGLGVAAAAGVSPLRQG